MELENLDIDVANVKKLKKMGFKTIEKLLLETNPSNLAEKTDLSTNEVKDLYQSMSDCFLRRNCQLQPIFPAATNTVENKISVGCMILDKKLGGGLFKGGIYEIFGECGSGKTQLCLQISANLIYSTSNSYVCYICTDDAFPIARLAQLFEYRYHIAPNGLKKFLDRLLIYHAVDLHQVCDCLMKIKKKMAVYPIELIVIDSIAGCARLNSENEPYATRLRTKYFSLFKRLFADCAKLMNDKYNHKLTLICINHVVDNFVEGTCVGIGPCLGLSWSNILNTRIFLKRLYPINPLESPDFSVLIDETSKQPETSTATPIEAIQGIPRILKVVFSSSHYSNPINCLFTICKKGIDGTHTIL